MTVLFRCSASPVEMQEIHLELRLRIYQHHFHRPTEFPHFSKRLSRLPTPQYNLRDLLINKEYLIVHFNSKKEKYCIII